MGKYLIFLDIDGTLLTPDYKNNFPLLINKIKDLQKKGNIVFSLNSNRSLHDLLPIAQEFGILGPLICENGIFVYFQNLRKKVILAPLQSLKKMKEIKRLFKKWVMESQNIVGKKMHYFKADTVSFIKDGTKHLEFPENSIILLDNKFRDYTISAHVRRLEFGKMVKDLQALKSLREYIEKQIKNNGFNQIVTVSSSDVFCNLLIYPKFVNKKTGVMFLKEKYYKDYKVIAIGDEITDFKMVEGIGDFWTVANASDQLKKISLKVAKNIYAKGVYELISQL